jgi:hypothetical protein
LKGLVGGQNKILKIDDIIIPEKYIKDTLIYNIDKSRLDKFY